MQNTSFITNSVTHNFYNSLQENLLCCSEFKMSVAFISYGGVQVLLETLQELSDRGVRGQILTISYQNFTQPKVLEKLSSFKNIELKIFIPPTDEDGFHAKGYLFRQRTENKKEKWTVIIGSLKLND